MRTLSILLCLGLVAFGVFSCLWLYNTAGLPLIIIGTLGFLIIAPNHASKNIHYKPKCWMNK